MMRVLESANEYPSQDMDDLQIKGESNHSRKSLGNRVSGNNLV